MARVQIDKGAWGPTYLVSTSLHGVAGSSTSENVNFRSFNSYQRLEASYE